MVKCLCWWGEHPKKEKIMSKVDVFKIPYVEVAIKKSSVGKWFRDGEGKKCKIVDFDLNRPFDNYFTIENEDGVVYSTSDSWLLCYLPVSWYVLI